MTYQPYVEATSNSSLLDAMNTSETLTLNGCPTHSTSSNFLVDLFFTVNTFRQKSEEEVIQAFTKAYDTSPQDALRILFWSRDIRGGQGERKTFRIVLKYLALNNPGVLQPLIQYIPYYGRWDDLFSLISTPLCKDTLDFIKSALNAGDALCAKWMPREKSSQSKLASSIRKHCGYSPKEYRKVLAGLTKVVETQMCNKDWEAIDYSKVPSRALLIYRKAFDKHAPSQWNKYLELVTAGEVKINSSTLYPYDIIRPLWGKMSESWYGQDVKGLLTPQEIQLTNEQWKALPNYMENNPRKILPLVDTSGSMHTCGSPSAIQVAVSLGLYIAEKNEGPFKDHFITFSQNPTIQKIEGDHLYAKIHNLNNADWGYNTNLEKVFDLILNSAVEKEVKREEMPDTLLILSDMEFDVACSGSASSTMYENIQFKYRLAGYKLPSIIFWNLDTKTSNSPVKFDEQGTALISGFSPTILKQLLANESLTPESMMYKVINSTRYSHIEVK